MPTIHPPTIGAIIRARRTELGLTASALARATDVVPAAVAHLERGTRRPHGQSMRRLAAALQLPVETLREAPTGGADGEAARDDAKAAEREGSAA